MKDSETSWAYGIADVYQSAIDFSRIPSGQLWPHQFQRDLMDSCFCSRVKDSSCWDGFLVSLLGFKSLFPCSSLHSLAQC